MNLEQWTSPTSNTKCIGCLEINLNKKRDHWDSPSKPDSEFNLWILCKWFPISIALTQSKKFREFNWCQFRSDKCFYLNLFAFLFGLRQSNWFHWTKQRSQIQLPDFVEIKMKFKFEFQSNKKRFYWNKMNRCDIVRISIIISNKVINLLLVLTGNEKKQSILLETIR